MPPKTQFWEPFKGGSPGWAEKVQIWSIIIITNPQGVRVPLKTQFWEPFKGGLVAWTLGGIFAHMSREICPLRSATGVAQQERSTKIPLRIWNASAPHPQEAHEALHEDPPQDLQRQRSIPTGGAAGAP